MRLSKNEVTPRSIRRPVTPKYGISIKPARRVQIILPRVQILQICPITFPLESISIRCIFVAIGDTAQSTKLIGVKSTREAIIEESCTPEIEEEIACKIGSFIKGRSIKNHPAIKKSFPRVCIFHHLSASLHP